jgi:hypothetical protein
VTYRGLFNPITSCLLGTVQRGVCRGGQVQ